MTVNDVIRLDYSVITSPNKTGTSKLPDKSSSWSKPPSSIHMFHSVLF